MEFFIKKNATLPVLKINAIKDGRSDYNRSMRFLEETDIFFSMVDVETGIPRITSRPAGLMKKDPIDGGDQGEYYVYYQFTPFDTKKLGRYRGQFLFRNDTGVLVLPLSEEVYINVTESFIIDDFEYQSCYVVDYPCCFGPVPPTPPGPVPPGPTTTSTTYPVTTTSTTYPVTTTTSTAIPCVVCTSGATLPPIGQTRTYNGITLTGGGSGYVTGSTVPTIPTCYSNWQSPQLGTTFLGRLNTTSPSPFVYELTFSQNVNNVSFRFINYSGFPPLYRETFTITLFQNDVEVPLTITPCEYCCATISGNTILATDGTDCQNGSGVFRFDTFESYNKIRIEGPGGGGGTFLDVCEQTIKKATPKSTSWTISEPVTDGRYFCDRDFVPYTTLYTEESLILTPGMQLFADEDLTIPVTFLLNTSFLTVVSRDGIPLTEKFSFTIAGSTEQYTTNEYVGYVLYCNQPVPCRELTITRTGTQGSLARWFNCGAQLDGLQIGLGQTITVCGSFPIDSTYTTTSIGPNC